VTPPGERETFTRESLINRGGAKNLVLKDGVGGGVSVASLSLSGTVYRRRGGGLEK